MDFNVPGQLFKCNSVSGRTNLGPSPSKAGGRRRKEKEKEKTSKKAEPQPGGEEKDEFGMGTLIGEV